MQSLKEEQKSEDGTISYVSDSEKSDKNDKQALFENLRVKYNINPNEKEKE